MKRTLLASAVAVLVALASTEAAAQHRGGGSRGGGGGRGGGGWHGGGSRGGGWHGGGGYAVPRSGHGHAVPRGGAAYVRHPRAGTGYGHGYGYRHGGYYGHGYYGHYRPYYSYRPYYYGGYWPYYGAYYPYYSPWYASLYWGWPYYGGSGFSVGLSYGPVHVAGSYATAPSYAVGAPAPAPAPRESRPAEPEGAHGRVRLEVRPEDASVYVDDRFRGTAREARSLRLNPGRHTIELVRPGFAVERREVEAVEGESVDVLVEMQPAARPRV